MCNQKQLSDITTERVSKNNVIHQKYFIEIVKIFINDIVLNKILLFYCFTWKN